MPMKRITVVAHLDNFTGYGQLAKAVVDQLNRLGYYASIRAITIDENPELGGPLPLDYKARIVRGAQPEDWEILISPPFTMPTPGKKTLWITMWESTRLPAGSVQLLNRANVVVVPNQWNAGCFSANGVNAPIRVMPLGVDDSVYNFRQFKNRVAPMVFGCAGRWLHGAERKGILETVDLYEAVFGVNNRDVHLHVKTFKDAPLHHNNASIKIENRFLSEAEMVEWYADIDCFISLATAEGWGLHQHQAMAVGRPLISVKYGGVAEFFNENCGYSLRFKPKQVPQPNRYRYSGCWAVIDQDDAMRAMQVMADRFLCERLGVEAHRAVSRFTWNNMGDELKMIMDEFGL